MSWYKKAWLFRRSIAVDHTGGVAATIDVSIALPADDDTLWSNVQSDGDDLYVTDADGLTKLNYDLTGFNSTNRTGTLRVDGYSAPEGGMLQLFVYFGNAAATSGQSAVTIDSPKTGYWETGCEGVPLIRCTRERAKDTKPRVTIAKAPNEVLHVWWDVAGLLTKRCDVYEDRDLYEEIDSVNFEVHANDADQSGLRTVTATRIVDGHYVRTEVKAGTSGTTYTMVLKVLTTTGRKLECRALLAVQTPKE